jgi:hypothetical protein
MFADLFLKVARLFLHIFLIWVCVTLVHSDIFRIFFKYVTETTVQGERIWQTHPSEHTLNFFFYLVPTLNSTLWLIIINI